ncbi:transposase InsO family protein [Pseudarthrobacter sp. PvP004]|nr:transposase InsO family protein [Pseudarthrobacter sp. PvP004]
MIYPLVTDLAADGVPVAVTCRVLKFSKQGYNRWRASPVTERDWVDAVNAARDIHTDDPAFGYRFIADELPEKGIMVGENRVQPLCRDHGIWSVFSKKRGLNRKPGPPVHDDLVERGFTAAAPNELRLTDITEHPTAEGKLYLCGEGRLFREDRRLFDGLTDEVLACRRRAGERGAGAPPGRDGGAFGPWVPVQVPPLR